MIKNKKLKTILISIIFLSLIVSYYQHTTYNLPLHVDEWFHISVAKEIATTNKFPILDVYTDLNFGASSGLEIAWHYFLALFAKLGFDVIQFMYLIPVIAVAAVLSVYYFARRWGEEIGLLSAFLTALIPSNVTMGGLQMLIPVNLSLTFIPIALKHAFDYGKIKDGLIVFLCTIILLYAHPPSALILVATLFIYTVLVRNQEKAKVLFTSLVLSGIAALPNYLPRLAERGSESATFPFWILLKQVPLLYGLIPSAFFVLGFYLFVDKGKPEERAIAAAVVLLIINVFVFSQTRISYIIPYQRTLIPLMMFMSILAAYGLWQVRDKIGPTIMTMLLLATLLLSVNTIIHTPYYHLIDDEDYASLMWIRENTPTDAVILADPFQARAVTPVAERRVYTVLPFGPNPEVEAINKKALDFFAANCTDTQFLKENKISVVYSPVVCTNNDLTFVRDKVYLVK